MCQSHSNTFPPERLNPPHPCRLRAVAAFPIPCSKHFRIMAGLRVHSSPIESHRGGRGFGPGLLHTNLAYRKPGLSSHNASRKYFWVTEGQLPCIMQRRDGWVGGLRSPQDYIRGAMEVCGAGGLPCQRSALRPLKRDPKGASSRIRVASVADNSSMVGQRSGEALLSAVRVW